MRPCPPSPVQLSVQPHLPPALPFTPSPTPLTCSLHCPQTGVEVERISLPSVTLSLKEVGGSMQGTWPSHLKSASAVIFCVSTASPPHLSSSLIHLISILNPPSSPPPAVLLLFTHIDSPFALSPSTLHSLCRFSDLAPPPTLHSLSCSPLTGEGCSAVLDRLASMALTLNTQ